MFSSWFVALHWAFAALFCLALAGCEPGGPRATLDTYLSRLATPLNATPRTTADPPIPRLPARSSLRSELPSAQLDTLDFLALSGCKVQITIGKRNSSLGRMASASQRLLLELEFLELAPACIDYMNERGNTELAGILSQAHALKRAQLPARIFNATLGGPEFRQLWRKPAQLGVYPAQTSSQVISALDAIGADTRRWLAGDYQADNRSFELQLSEVNKGDGGSLMAALAMQSSALATADAMLETAVLTGPLCHHGLRPDAADILPRVVQKYFIEAIQPWSAALDRRRFELLPPVAALEQAIASALPEAYRQWQRQRDRQIEHWVAAPKRHVQTLQSILESCGGMRTRETD